MKPNSPSRGVLLAYAGLSLIVVIAGSIAGVGTYALLSDEEHDKAGTISFVDTAAVSFSGSCKKANVTASDPNNFNMIVTIENGSSKFHNESDFTANASFEYWTRNYWSGNPKMSDITLDGMTYKCT